MLTVFHEAVAQEIQKPGQPQLAVDDGMAALLRIVDTDIESSGEHIDECRQIDPCAVDAAYSSGEM